MLEDLTIKNFALLDSVYIEFSKGFTVLSGETGAGKSILIGALSFLLGGKAGVEQIRSGASEASVTGTFLLPPVNNLDKLGIKKNPGTKLKYIEINDNLYACDENCQYYNQIIDAKKTKHQCKGEHLIDYCPQYNYGLCIDFNSENIYPNGSNIFIHVKGKKDYTAGCIAIDEDSMVTVLKNSTNKTKVIIY